jgi:hypothetical protein
MLRKPIILHEISVNQKQVQKFSFKLEKNPFIIIFNIPFACYRMFWIEHFNEFLLRRFHIPDEVLPMPLAYTTPNIINNDIGNSDDDGQFQIGIITQNTFLYHSKLFYIAFFNYRIFRVQQKRNIVNENLNRNC